jgi:hypothetical protein
MVDVDEETERDEAIASETSTTVTSTTVTSTSDAPRDCDRLRIRAQASVVTHMPRAAHHSRWLLRRRFLRTLRSSGCTRKYGSRIRSDARNEISEVEKT